MRFRPHIMASCVATLLALAAPQPAPAGVIGTVGDYCEDRFWDFTDLFRLRVGVPRHGEGYGAKARVTALAQIGYVHYNGHYIGMERRGLGLMDEERTEGGISLAYASYNEMVPRFGNRFQMADTLWSEIEHRRIVRNLPYWDDGRGHFLSVGAEVATPILGVDVGVYPEEALDFVTGLVLIDLFNDDELMMGGQSPYIKPTTLPEPDMEAATRRKKAEMDALYGDLRKEKEESEGQELSDKERAALEAAGLVQAEAETPAEEGSEEAAIIDTGDMVEGEVEAPEEPAAEEPAQPPAPIRFVAAPVPEESFRPGEPLPDFVKEVLNTIEAQNAPAVPVAPADNPPTAGDETAPFRANIEEMRKRRRASLDEELKDKQKPEAPTTEATPEVAPEQPATPVGS